MTFARDIEQWAVYSAEGSLAPGLELQDLPAAQSVIDAIVGSRRWREWFPYFTSVEVQASTVVTEDGFLLSYAQQDKAYLAERATIFLHCEMLNEVVLIHELAHCVAPRWGAVEGALPVRITGRLKADALFVHHDHGHYFRGALALLLAEFGHDASHEELGVAYRHYGLSVAEPEALFEAASVSRQVESAWLEHQKELEARADEFAAEEAEWRRAAEERGTPLPPHGEERIPAELWADFLMLGRWRLQRTGGRSVWTQERVAELVSRVEPCRRRDIGAVERAESRPDDPRQLRIAMYMAVLYGTDPVYMRWVKRLTRWDCGVLMKELAQINPAWVRLVRKLNRMQRGRQPQWVVQGDR